MMLTVGATAVAYLGLVGTALIGLKGEAPFGAHGIEVRGGNDLVSRVGTSGTVGGLVIGRDRFEGGEVNIAIVTDVFVNGHRHSPGGGCRPMRDLHP